MFARQREGREYVVEHKERKNAKKKPRKPILEERLKEDNAAYIADLLLQRQRVGLSGKWIDQNSETFYRVRGSRIYFDETECELKLCRGQWTFLDKNTYCWKESDTDRAVWSSGGGGGDEKNIVWKRVEKATDLSTSERTLLGDTYGYFIAKLVHLSVKWSALTVLKLLCKFGADVNARIATPNLNCLTAGNGIDATNTFCSHTPLHCLLKSMTSSPHEDQLSIFRILISNGADLDDPVMYARNHRVKGKPTPRVSCLQLAKRSLHITSLLLKANADPNLPKCGGDGTILHWIDVRDLDTHEIAKFVKLYCDSSIPIDLNKRKADNKLTALQAAAHHFGNKDTNRKMAYYVELLINIGCDIEARGQCTGTPLLIAWTHTMTHYNRKHSSFPVFETLLSWGANCENVRKNMELRHHLPCLGAAYRIGQRMKLIRKGETFKALESLSVCSADVMQSIVDLLFGFAYKLESR